MNPLKRDVKVDATPDEVVVAEEIVVLLLIVEDVITMDRADIGGDCDVGMDGVAKSHPSCQCLETGCGMPYLFEIGKG